MAPVAADGTAIIGLLLTEFGEDYVRLGRLLGRLEIAYPAINWRSIATTAVNNDAGMTASRLSKAWFLATVAKYADAFKAG